MKTSQPAEPKKDKQELISTELSFDSQAKIDGQIQDAINDIRDFDEIRILKDRGFNGVVPPITVRIPGTQAASADNYTGACFIADRPYEIIEVREIHDHASAGGELDIRHASPVSGDNTILDGRFDLSTAAGFVQYRTLKQIYPCIFIQVFNGFAVNVLQAGDILYLDPVGTIADARGICVSLTLKAI